MGGLFVCSILPFLSWNYETKDQATGRNGRDSITRVKLVEERAGL